MDERVASAISHWGPRFTTNGVTVADFERVTRSVARWSDWCAAWSAVGAEHEALGRTALAGGRNRSAGEHLAMAAVYYHFGKFLFVEQYDEMRAAHANAVRCLNDALPHLDPPGERVEIPFEGTKLVGIFRAPSRGDGPFPAVLMLPGLDSTKEEFRSTEKTFLDRGIATFSLDGPGQGEAEYDLPIRGDWSAPGAAALDTLGGRPEVDADRLAVWGVSLGGYYSPRVAAAVGDRVKACVALAGPYNFGLCWDQLPPLTRKAFEVRSKARDDGEARSIALTLDLAGQTSKITAPTLIVAGRLDRLIPWQQAEQVAGEVQNSELLMLEDGNHGNMNVWPKHRPYTADWVAARLTD
ncbi:MAG: alpha/beta hydrolase family protein [Actinomycetes bacterium]